MPQFNRPYTIIDINEMNLTITLDMPNSLNVFLTFHTSVVIENDVLLFPGHEFSKPAPVTTEDSMEEYFICDIIDKQC